MNTLEIDEVNKNIKDNHLFNKISFKLEKGKIYGLCGENGSGKSTLIKMILNLSNYTGKISIYGKDIKKNYKEVSNKISALVDYVSLYDFLTAKENLRYFSLLYKTDKERVNECIKLLKINEDDKIVKNFSLGMKQRLGIAIALLKDPDILILDEPTNGLDPVSIRDLRNLLLSLKDKTIIISSHLISEIEKICSDILFINKNKITHKVINDFKKIEFTIKKDDKEEILIKDNMTNNEINEYVKDLVNNNISIYKIEEKNTLEDTLIKMMEENYD